MKERVRNWIVKPAALTAFFAAIYPGVLAGRTALFGNRTEIFDFIISLCFLYSGYAVAMFIMNNMKLRFFLWLDDFGNKLLTASIFKKAKGKAMRMLFSYCLLVIPFAISYFIYKAFVSDLIWRSLFEAVFAFIFFFIGIRGGMTEVTGILSKSRISFGIFALAMTLYLCSKFEVIYQIKSLTYYFGYFFLFLTMLLKTQSNLDYNLFARKGLDTQGTAANMRRYNSGAAILLFLITVLALNLKEIVMFLLNLSRQIFAGIVVLFLAIITMFYPAGDPGGAPNQSQQTGFQLPAPDETDSLARQIMEIVFYIIVISLILLFLYKLLRILPGKVRNIFNKLRDIIKARLTALFSSNESNEEYSDEIEVVKPDDGIIETTSLRNDLKKQKRNLSKIKDPVQRVRYTYLSLIELLGRHSVKIQKSDTTGEIFKKAVAVNGIRNELKDVTVAYEDVRYGDRVPDEKTLNELEGNFNNITHKLKR